jgi:NAD(P)H dehydrogenase (quinone)
MNLLTVFSHPFTDKYPAAVMNAFHEPFLEAGHSIDILDLHREGFYPRFTEEDHAHFWGGAIPEEIASMHRRVENADRLAFVFPVYWWSMPALMKGWIERVFTGGWAYQFVRELKIAG